MKTADAVRHFGSQSALARALTIKRASVSAWGECPPIDRQCQIEVLTGGALKADRDKLYPPVDEKAA
jgi:hypothetical protein